LKIQVGSGLNPRTLNRVVSEISRFNPNIRKNVVFVSCPDGADLVKCVSGDFWKSATSLSNSLECKARLDHINGINEPAENDGYVQFLVGCLSNLRRNTKALNKLLKRDLGRHSPGETLEAVRGYDSDKEITLEQEIFTQTLRRLRDYQWHEFDAIRRQFIKNLLNDLEGCASQQELGSLESARNELLGIKSHDTNPTGEMIKIIAEWILSYSEDLDRSYGEQLGLDAKIQFLVEKGSDVNAPRYGGTTSLHLAAKQGNLEAVYLLIEKGANPDAKDSEKKTPADLAHENGHFEVHAFLVSRDYSELEEAIKNGDLQKTQNLVEELIKGDDKKIFTKNKHKLKTDRSTYLHIAVETSTLEVVDYLLETAGETGLQISAQRALTKDTALHLSYRRIRDNPEDKEAIEIWDSLKKAPVKNTKNAQEEDARELHRQFLLDRGLADAQIPLLEPALIETENRVCEDTVLEDTVLEHTVFEHKRLIVGRDDLGDLLRIAVCADNWGVVRFLLDRPLADAQILCGDQCSLLHLLLDRESHEEDLENIKQNGTFMQKAACTGDVAILNTFIQSDEQHVDKILMTRAALGGFLAGKSATITLSEPSIKFLVSKAIDF
jgi:hypothetical protein